MGKFWPLTVICWLVEGLGLMVVKSGKGMVPSTSMTGVPTASTWPLTWTIVLLAAPKVELVIKFVNVPTPAVGDMRTKTLVVKAAPAGVGMVRLLAKPVPSLASEACRDVGMLMLTLLVIVVPLRV